MERLQHINKALKLAGLNIYNLQSASARKNICAEQRFLIPVFFLHSI
jgi:hypothetical protein